MRSKTHDDQPPPAAPPATKKQKAETEQKAKGEAAQSSESKKRSLDEPASSTQTEAVRKAKRGRKAAEAEKTPPKPAPDSETAVIEVATQVATQESDETVKEVATQVATQESDEKRCFFCNLAESQSVKAFQVNSKKAGTYKCQKCTSSRTYFYDSGDFPHIIKLTEEDRWKFFQSCKDATKDKQLEMIRSLKTSNIDNKIHETGYKGRFIPESVLTKKGYDVERIKNNSAPEDKYEDVKLGWCYRINIKKDDFTHQQGTKNSDEYEATDRPGSASSESIGAKMTKMLSALSAGKENSALSKKRIGLIEKEKTYLNKLKMEIRLNKVPKCMNANDAFKSLFEQVEAIDHLDDNFDEKLAEYRAASSPMVKALKMFV